MIRTVMLRLLPDEVAEERLKTLCNLSSKLWNEVNYARRRMFFETKRVDLRQTYKEFYERYKKLIGSATTQQILNKNNEAWRSFFSSLKAKKEGKLPPYITRVNPPGYRKRGGRRTLWSVLRNDQYNIDGEYIVIKGLGAIGSIRVKYSGSHSRREPPRWRVLRRTVGPRPSSQQVDPPSQRPQEHISKQKLKNLTPPLKARFANYFISNSF